MDTATPTVKVMPKPLTAPEAKPEEQDGGDDGGGVGVGDGAPCPAEPGQHRRTDAAPGSVFLLGPLEHQHVGVHRHADGQHEAGDPGQGECGVEGEQDGVGDEPVGEKGNGSQRSEQVVVGDDVEDREGGADQGGLNAGTDGGVAEGGPDRALLHDLHRHRQSAGADEQGEVLGLRLAEVARDLGLAAG
jgi:hypothetical protein